jgi:hypothetical protein
MSLLNCESCAGAEKWKKTELIIEQKYELIAGLKRENG